MDITKMAEGWIPLGGSAPEGMRKCQKCGETLPESEFYVNALRNARFTMCKGCFADEAFVLGSRLAWYVSKSRPADYPEEITVSADENERWLMSNAESPEGMRMIIKARNLRLPREEVGMLIDRGASPHVLKGEKLENDPNAGLNDRLNEFFATFGSY